MARTPAPAMPTAKQIRDAYEAVRATSPNAVILCVGPAGVRFGKVIVEETKFAYRFGELLVPMVGKSASAHRPGYAISASLRATILARDGEVCAYCGSTSGPLHIDHVTPWSRGGETEPGNLTVSCKPCNVSKRDMTPEEWRAKCN